MSHRLSAMMSSSSILRWALMGKCPLNLVSRYFANTSTWRASSITCVDA